MKPSLVLYIDSNKVNTCSVSTGFFIDIAKKVCIVNASLQKNEKSYQKSLIKNKNLIQKILERVSIKLELLKCKVVKKRNEVKL